jgi:hypothetical protein
MRAAAGDGVSPSDEEAARQLEEQEQLSRERVRRAHSLLDATRAPTLLDLRAAAAAPALLPVQEVRGRSAAAQPVGATDRRSSRTPINYSDDTRSVDYSSTRWPLGWWLFCLSVCVWAWVARSVCG